MSKETVLISMAVYDTVENKRTEYTKKTLESLLKTVDLDKHVLYIINNNSCEETTDYLNDFRDSQSCILINNKENLGTAEAINLAWQYRKNRHCIKIDNDVVIHEKDWIEKLLDCVNRDETIGQIGLKRKDCWENPNHQDLFYQSKLLMLPHNLGEKWLIVEEVNHVMGTCVLHTDNLLNKVGYLYQPGLYGFDDSLMSFRCRLVGLKCVFYPHIEIDHIDRGDTSYQKEKEELASKVWAPYHETIAHYKQDIKNVYYNPYE